MSIGKSLHRFVGPFRKRFFRRLINAFRFRDMWSWQFESCERCGSCYRFLFFVKDKTWISVYGSENGCLCPSCFIEAAQQKGVWVTVNDIVTLHPFYGNER